MTYDVIVVGVGTFGAPTLYYLALQGLKVLGLEQFSIPHSLGSYAGNTRIFRLIYPEGQHYIPLAVRALSLWKEIEGKTKTELLVTTGSVDAWPAGSPWIEPTLDAAVHCGLQHEIVTGTEANKKYPGFSLPEDYTVVFQPDGGVLKTSDSVTTFSKLAAEHGAIIHTGQRVSGFKAGCKGVSVSTEHGEFKGLKLILACGAWLPSFLQRYKDSLRPERQVMVWYDLQPAEQYSCDRFPVFNVVDRIGRKFAGHPITDCRGVKILKDHHLGEDAEPDSLDRVCSASDEKVVRPFTDEFLSARSVLPVAMETCMYTNTPDGDFVLDSHPDCENVFVASPCSGHGFKFAPVVGQLLSQIVIGEQRDELVRYSFARFDTKQ